MTLENESTLKLRRLLEKYTREDLPDFAGELHISVNQVNGLGEAPIHIACVRGVFSDVQTLVEGGAKLNLQGDMGRTPLHEAVARGFADIVEYLLVNGADSSIRDEFGMTPMEIASQEGNELLISMLSDSSRTTRR